MTQPRPHGRPAPERTVLAMEGADAVPVLQGIVTNDVSRLTPDRLVYAALLTPQGKYLFDFFVFRDGAGRVLIDVASDRAPALAQRISMYCLRRDARLMGAAGLEVALVWGAEPEASEGVRVMPDPRNPALGWRVYAKDLGPVLGTVDKARPGEFTALRVAHAVPESGIELVPEGTYILEAGFERLGGVDFRKGCYVGQEVTARMKHKTELRKRLVRVSVEGEAPVGTPVTAGERTLGTLFSQAGNAGLAHLRLDRVDGEMEAGAARLRLAE